MTRLTGLLLALEDMLDALGSPFSSYALPGIDDDQIDELLAPSGLVVPTELREWWRWHHGSREDAGENDRHTIGPGSWGLMSIPWALEDAADWASTVAPEEGWGPNWLPFAWARPFHARLVARLDDSTPDEVCVGWYYVFDVPPEEPVAYSMAEMVESILRVLREGLTYWNPAGVYFETVGRWQDVYYDDFGRSTGDSRQAGVPRYLNGLQPP